MSSYWYIVFLTVLLLLSIALPSNNSFTKPAGILVSKDGMSSDKGTITSDSEFTAHDVKADILEDKAYQPESNTNSSTL